MAVLAVVVSLICFILQNWHRPELNFLQSAYSVMGSCQRVIKHKGFYLNNCSL